MKWPVFNKLFLVFLQQAFSFRIEAWMWIINGLITPLVSLAFWLKVLEGQSNLEMNSGQLITYFLLLTAVKRFSQTWTNHWLSRHIKNGGLSGFLLKPYRFEIYNLARDLSYKLLRMLTLVPLLGILIWWFMTEMQIPKSGETWFWFGLALVLGSVINYLFESVMGMLGFFFTETEDIDSAWQIIVGLINGFMIPLVMLPVALQTIAYGMYTRFLISFPLEIVLGQVQGDQITTGFEIGILWIIILSILYLLLWQFGLKRYSAVGI